MRGQAWDDGCLLAYLWDPKMANVVRLYSDWLVGKGAMDRLSYEINLLTSKAAHS